MNGKPLDYSMCSKYQTTSSGTPSGLNSGEAKYFECENNLTGKYVIIQLIQNFGYLSFSEVEVFGKLHNGYLNK